MDITGFWAQDIGSTEGIKFEKKKKKATLAAGL